VENVFYLPGLGRLIFQSISNRDLIVVRNCVLLLAAMVVVVNFVVDVLYAAIDPRVKPGRYLSHEQADRYPLCLRRLHPAGASACKPHAAGWPPGPAATAALCWAPC
jgi:hypothetical protein